ncbi:hypothetical protein AgCh_001779 [Apium graveolens]
MERGERRGVRRPFQEGEIQNSKGVDLKSREVSGESLLIDFITTNANIVDKDVIAKVIARDEIAKNDALNQIHWRSLRFKANRNEDAVRGLPFCSNKKEKKSYVGVVKELSISNPKLEWKIVTHKKKKEATKMNQTNSEEEAGKIFSNLKQLKGLGKVLRMSINMSINPKGKKVIKGRDIVQLDSKFNTKRTDDGVKKVDEYGEIFKYIESEIDSEIEEAFEESLIGIFLGKKNVQEVVEDLKEMGVRDVIVVKGSEGIFFMRKEHEGWLELDKEKLATYFVKIMEYKVSNQLMPRLVAVECEGLPIYAWTKGNLKAFTKDLGNGYHGVLMTP